MADCLVICEQAKVRIWNIYWVIVQGRWNAAAVLDQEQESMTKQVEPEAVVSVGLLNFVSRGEV